MQLQGWDGGTVAYACNLDNNNRLFTTLKVLQEGCEAIVLNARLENRVRHQRLCGLVGASPVGAIGGDFSG